MYVDFIQKWYQRAGSWPGRFLRELDLIKLSCIFGQTGLSEHFRPRSDIAFCGVWSGSALFPANPAILHTFIGSTIGLFKSSTLRKHAYSNILKISPPKTEKNSVKISDIFHISVQNIDCEYSLELPRRGSSNEYPQSMFLSRNRKNNVYPCKPQFYYKKVGFKGVKII